MRQRWTGHSESAGNITTVMLREAMDHVVQNVTDTHSRFRDYYTSQFASFVNDSGYECLKNGTRCQGDCRDTIYARGTSIGKEFICNKTVGHICKPSMFSELTKKNDDYFIVGVNHQMTNHSVYSTLTAYTYPKLAPGVMGKN
jgi:hypothetical protein